MGLIDSTNRIERAILSDKQARRLEREEKKRDKAIKDRDKLDLSISKDLMQQALAEEISEIYEILGYNGASLYFKSLESKEKIILKVAKNELDYKISLELYDKILPKLDKIYKNNDKYIQAQKLEELKENERQEAKKQEFNDVCKMIALCIYKAIIGIFKVLGFLLLICAGFTKFIFMIQPQHKKRYK